MIDELIAHLVAKTGMSPEQAQTAVHAVIGFLKQRLPAPLASHLDSMLGITPEPDATSDGTTDGAADSAAAGGGLAGEASAVLGSLFGRK